MSDLADRAEADIEHELAEALRLLKAEGPAATGFCLYCKEPIEHGLRWCVGTECRDEWQRQEQQRRWKEWS